MSTGQIAALALAAVLVFWMLGAYNRLVALRNAIGSAWLQVDEALARRGDLLTQLVNALRGPLAGEAAALDVVLSAQAQMAASAEALRPRVVQDAATGSVQQADARLAAAQARLLALVEGDPALAAALEVRPLLDALRDAEPKVAFVRQLFNDAVQTYNDAAQAFPTRLLTRLYGFGRAGSL